MTKIITKLLKALGNNYLILRLGWG